MAFLVGFGLDVIGNRDSRRVFNTDILSIRNFVTKNPRPARYIRDMGRPRLAPGNRRLEWICDCGKRLYGDFDNSNPASIETLQDSLTTHANEGGSSNAPPGSNVTSNQEHSVAGDLGVRKPQYRSKGKTPERRPAPLGTSQNPISDFTRPPQWFELLAYSRKGEKTLGEISLVDIKTDGELFRTIKQRYNSIRGSQAKYLYLLKPVDIHFVQFSLQDRYRAFIHDAPRSWPPAEATLKGQWEYEIPKTGPPVPPPPIPPDAFFHHFWSDEKLHRRAIWLRRMPKKLGHDIRSEPLDLPVGWGILIIEGLNKKKASWILFSAMAVVFILGTFWSIYKQQGVSISILALMVLSLVGSLLTSEFFAQLGE
ncbi:uncharacterized protein KY384_005701 [Bacidia gigantensis]|uniref:uncharacterized protein n=1 Tax=Bacidia gigantensis TaxID=2732470 RepID=UPI001D04C051|nr:uncharacterized protein KY384_005701 [Bacidia gigantensis]KAG8529066.1 hypothetical protein KY384_005701 [Bacidia gigantensis]